MKATTWTITKQGRVKRIKVQARTLAQLERSRANAATTPPPLHPHRRVRPS